MKWKEPKILFIILIFVVGSGALIGYFWIQPTWATPQDWQKETTIQSTFVQTKTSSITGDSTEEKPAIKETILVDIKGAVNKPGVYEMKKDARMHQLVQLAGGMTDLADAKMINLATILVDQQMIYIPAKGEVIEGLMSQTTETNDTNKRVQKININQASISELQAIKGVGEKKAQAIIDYRTKNGKFLSVDQLAEVDGFGKKTVDKIRESITI